MNRLHLILPVVAGLAASNASALEAVAQSPVGGGSALGAANFATDAKITAVKSQTSGLVQSVSQLKDELKNFTDCAAEGKLWNGSACVEVKGDNGDDGNKGEDGKIALPTCTTSQTLVSYDGKSLVCKDISLDCLQLSLPDGTAMSHWGTYVSCPASYMPVGCGCTDSGCATTTTSKSGPNLGPTLSAADQGKSPQGCRVYGGGNGQSGWMICCRIR